MLVGIQPTSSRTRATCLGRGGVAVIKRLLIGIWILLGLAALGVLGWLTALYLEM